MRLSGSEARRIVEPLSRINIGKSFLSLSSKKWNDNDDCRKGKEWLQNLQIVSIEIIHISAGGSSVAPGKGGGKHALFNH